jgi:hypothetical protein
MLCFSGGGGMQGVNYISHVLAIAGYIKAMHTLHERFIGRLCLSFEGVRGLGRNEGALRTTGLCC